MCKFSFLILLCFILISQLFVPSILANEKDEWDQAEESIGKLKPQLPTLSDQFPNDLEVQLGIAAIYFQYGAPQEDLHQSSEEYAMKQEQKFVAQCKKVFDIDPDNKPALAILSARICTDFTGVRNLDIDQLERLIAVARARNSKEIEIFQNSSLGKYFSEGDNCVIGKRPYGNPPVYALLISDFDSAMKQVHEKTDEDFPNVLAQINDAQIRDPDNAFYNYLKAHLFFELVLKNEALKEVEEGVSKKYFSSFQEELAIAKNNVFQKAHLTQKSSDFLIKIRQPFEDFVIQHIWNGGLSNIGKDYEKKGDFKTVEKIYKLTYEMAKQIQKEQIYDPLGLDNIAQNRINRLLAIKNSNQGAKIIAQNESSKKKPLWITLPIACVGVVLIVVAGCVLFLRKKKSNKTE